MRAQRIIKSIISSDFNFWSLISFSFEPRRIKPGPLVSCRSGIYFIAILVFNLLTIFHKVWRSLHPWLLLASRWSVFGWAGFWDTLRPHQSATGDKPWYGDTRSSSFYGTTNSFASILSLSDVSHIGKLPSVEFILAPKNISALKGGFAGGGSTACDWSSSRCSETLTAIVNRKKKSNPAYKRISRNQFKLLVCWQLGILGGEYANFALMFALILPQTARSSLLSSVLWFDLFLTELGLASQPSEQTEIIRYSDAYCSLFAWCVCRYLFWIRLEQ